MALLASQLRYEQKSFWRNPASAFFTFAWPVAFFVLFASLFHANREATLGGVPAIDYYVPSIIAFSVANACFANLAVTTCMRRDRGQLKVIRGTPLPSWAYLGGVILNQVLISVALTVIIVAVGSTAYGADLPRHWGALVVTLLVGVVSFCALGLAVSVAVPNADAAPVIINLALLVLLLISGVFFPLPSASVLSQVARYLPMRPLILATFATFDPRHHGGAFSSADLLTMAAWGLAALAVAVPFFRWEPRKT